VLDGHYRLAAETASFAVYRRRDPGSSDDAVTAEAFLENLAHPAYADRIAVNGQVIDAATAVDRVPALWQSRGDDVSLTSQWSLHVDPEHDAPVHSIYIAGGAPERAVRIDVALTAANPAGTQRFTAVFEPGAPIVFATDTAAGHPVDTIDIRMSSVSGDPTRVWVDAIRVMGQTPELREHLLAHDVPGD
jgi:hypothetical protein